MKTLDLTDLKVVAARDLEAAGKDGATELVLREDAVLTPSARDLLARFKVSRRSSGGKPSAAANGAATPQVVSAYGDTGKQVQAVNPAVRDLYYSDEAEKIKDEIIAVGRKLWHRQYVDGNGGNISYRIGPNEVLCTPTLISKADLRPEDICMVDLEGNQLVGSRPRTSEILLHLEIYKAVPQAKGVVHCHPAHATAYAITGHVPPSSIIPEYDVFIGSCAVSPYETPGTQKFAETVIPFVQHHNTVLLANHGIVCWADTVTHAEWYAEVVETYCATLMIAAQLGVPISRIPDDKAADLLAIKKKLGLPDARFSECHLSDLPDAAGMLALPPPKPCPRPSQSIDDQDAERIVQQVTDYVMAALNGRGANR